MPSPKNKNRSNKRKSKGRSKPKSNKKTKSKGKDNKETKPKQKHIKPKANDDDNKTPATTTKVVQLNQSKKCGHCAKPNAESLCGGCKKIFYCNQQCQVAHWKKHKNLCNFIQKQNKQIKNDLFTAKNINVNDNYIKRIDLLLAVYAQFIDNNGQSDQYNDIHELISAHYPGLKIDYFIYDHSKYVQNIDANNICKENDGKCDLAQCQYIQREYRDRSIYDIDPNNDQRYKLYHNSKSEKSIIICQFLDALHVVKYHLLDLGLRYFDKDSKLEIMIASLIAKREKFNKIRHVECAHKMPNKFVTEIMLEEDSKNDEKENAQTPHHSFGFRFYYHDYFKNNENTKEMIPGGFGLQDFGNTAISQMFTFKEWYIAPKYKDIKEEILNSIQHKLTMLQYGNTLMKATLKHNALKKSLRGAVAIWEKVYEIAQGSPITLHHILAVLLYTNNPALACQFGKSYRQLSVSETCDSLKKRHCSYAHWAKLLRETVDCWGTFLEQAEFEHFYHGISCHLLFAKLNERFAAPMSVTLHFSTATMLSNEASDNGIVVTFDNNQKPALFFDCVPWSDYPGEMEMLFVGGLTLLQIAGLSATGKTIAKYDRYIKSVQIFQAVLVNAQTLSEQISPVQRKLIAALIDTVLPNESKEEREEIEPIPMYIQSLFKNLLSKIGRVTIDIDRLSKHKCYVGKCSGAQYGGKLLSHFYLTEKKHQIKWNVLENLFPSLWTIHISRSAKMSSTLSGFKFVKSIKITKELLKTILTHLSHARNDWGWIDIHFPTNTKKQLNQLIDAHQASFNKTKFKLLVKKSNHPQYGSCDSFCIHQLL